MLCLSQHLQVLYIIVVFVEVDVVDLVAFWDWSVIVSHPDKLMFVQSYLLYINAELNEWSTFIVCMPWQWVSAFNCFCAATFCTHLSV